MVYHLVHALVLTPFEASLPAQTWEEIAATDYPIHALYCEESRNLLFHSDGLKFDCAEEISKIIKTIENLGNGVELCYQILKLEADENEYSAQDVIKHFH